MATLPACGGLTRKSENGATSTRNLVAATEGTSTARAKEPPPFFPLLIERARGLAAAPPRPSGAVDLPPSLGDIDYEAYRRIRYRSEAALWHGQPGRFEAQFFHMGYAYREPVPMFVVEKQEAKPFPFSTDLFSYDGVAKPPPPDPSQLQFTGVRLYAPLNDRERRDEFIVFQGASYFRVVGRDQWYGLSARGLAIDTGEPTPEEFPRFSEIYLEKPAAEGDSMWVMALLESRRATGAYAMHVRPGDTTTVEVVARIFLREAVGVLGVAPLTSMFLFGEEEPARFGGYRPEVHDSDGLVMAGANGEQLFRPLRNPPRTTVCSFRLDSPRGFGLVQRDRDFRSYQDFESRYQMRPSVWVEPLSDWGEGAVRLLEIATKLETDDNIAVVWVPAHPPRESLALHYRLHFGLEAPSRGDLGQVRATRYLDRGAENGRFLVDFSLPSDADENDEPELDVSISGARVTAKQVQKNPFSDGYRAVIDVAREQADDVELRAMLRKDSRVLTETWSYLWQPNR